MSRIGKIYESWSIKVRLAVLLIAASTVVSYAMFNIMHGTLYASLSREEHDFLFDRLHTIRAIINDNADYLRIIKKDIDWEGQHVQFPYYYLRILDDSDSGLIETPGMSGVVPARLFPPPIRATRPGKDGREIAADNGRYYLLMTDSVSTFQAGPKNVTVQIALDVTSEVTINKGNHTTLFLAVFLRGAIYAVIIVLIIRKVLKPLDEMVILSETVTVNRISERAQPEGWPREVKRVALAFNEMLDRLEDAFGRLSHCTANMAHELRTPINNIMGEVEIALSRERTPEEYRKVLVSALEECQRLSKLNSTLLFLARADNPSDSITAERFSAMEQILEVVDFYDPQIEEKGARISYAGDGDLNGDPLLFRQAVSNLLRNALNYSPFGVKIGFTVTAVDRYLDVIVSDTGDGIEEADIPRIFDRFQRLGRGGFCSSGTGLGLAIVRAVMELHRGTILVTSKPGQGTQVTLRFPRAS